MKYLAFIALGRDKPIDIRGEEYEKNKDRLYNWPCVKGPRDPQENASRRHERSPRQLFPWKPQGTQGDH